MATYTITIWGERLSTDAVLNLVATLLVDGRPDAINLADRLDNCVDLEAVTMALNPTERDTLVSVLEDPPDDLAEFRGKLLRDWEWRHNAGLT